MTDPMNTSDTPEPGALDGESVKLLRKGDILKVIDADSFLSTRGHPNGALVTVRSVDGVYIDIAEIPVAHGTGFNRFEFVSRPADAGEGDFVLVPRKAVRSMTMAGCDRLPAVDGVFGVAGALCSNVWDAMVEEGEKLAAHWRPHVPAHSADAGDVVSGGEGAFEQRAIMLTKKHGNPVGTDYEQGQNDMGHRMVTMAREADTAIAALRPSAGAGGECAHSWTEDSAGQPSNCLDCGTAIIYPATPARPDPETEGLREILQEARFLLDRLSDFENELIGEESFRHWAGHVAPSMARLRQALQTTEGE